ncbi:outer membrane protein, cobalt-zinc-cadmium efflux system [Solimonas aquatica]|uniref:Outer membrane protein, cobalt-zinc-cadmium efflux system n=1 Tax=Solimonas aquatica TaxID=489703 RepID=A0A1H9EJ74_9GAMM|nr:TolC family protein [Solimonas aquatica]SEQ25709.1 outer membrane protein, cobalt-zinc-cadmium efflux system [Solimonas aquatica]
MREVFSLLVLGAVLLPPGAMAQADTCAGRELSLTAALDLAAQHNADLLGARAQLAAAQAGERIAAQRPNPLLNTGITQWDPRARNRGEGLYQQPAYSSVQLQQLIERGGKRQAREQAAQAGSEAAQADLADAQRRLQAQVRDGYYDLKLALARAGTLQDIAALQAQTLAVADHRLKVGDLAQADRARIAVETYRAQGEARQAQADAQAARLAYGALLGCPLTQDLQATDDWPQQAPSLPRDGARADEIADQQRLRAAEAQLKLAQAQATRDVTLGLEWEHDPREAPNMAGISVSVPLFVYHHYQGEIAQARAQLDSARATAAQTALQADVERDSAELLLDAAAQRRQSALAQVLPQAQAAAEAVEYAYAKGAAPLTDLLDARRALRSARLDALSAQNDFAKALAARDAALAPYRRSEP